MDEYKSKWSGQQIDEAVGQALESINDKTPTFEAVSNRDNITSGETVSVLFGKIRKWFADLKGVAFTANYSDLNGTPSALKNPKTLTFTGSASGGYDGSADMTVNIPAAYTLPLATSGARGGVRIGYGQNGRNYPVALSSEQMYVNVPWTDTITQVKGNSESAYRQGQVNLTAANIGAVPTAGGTMSGNLRFTNDNADFNISSNASKTRGMWDYNANGWILSTDSNNTVALNGAAQGGTVIRGTDLTLSAVGSATGSSANAYIHPSNYKVGLVSGSSRRYKHDIGEIKEATLDPHRLYDLPIVQFVYNDGYLIKEDERNGKTLPGFIVEDMENIYPIAVDHDAEGRPTNWTDRFLIPAMLALIQEQHEEIEALKRSFEKI